MKAWGLAVALVGSVLLAISCRTVERAENHIQFTALFTGSGQPSGWQVGEWNDVSRTPANGSRWWVTNGVLYGSQPRGSWLMSERVYTNFILEYEFRLGPRGNSGCALRAPLYGDPAFDGMEFQMADYRYNTEATAAELTGGIYRALAPAQQVYRPEEWNSCRIELRGSRLRATLNGIQIQDVDLNTQTNTVLRHDGSLVVALKDRPRSGHIGFQELSRADGQVMIRNARIAELP